MPTPKGTKEERCSQQRALFRENPEYARTWIAEFGDQCKGVTMKSTKKISMNSRKRRGKK